MHSPFPGMDPYLEDPLLWPDFHGLLIAAMQGQILPPLRHRYVLVVEHRRYMTALPGHGQREEPYLEIRSKDGRLITLLDVVSPTNKTTPEGRQAYLDQRRKAKDSQANLVEIDLVLQGLPMLDYSRDGLPDWDYSVTVTRST